MDNSLNQIMNVEAVFASYVYSSSGEMITMTERGSAGDRPQPPELGKLVKHIAGYSRKLTEATLFYPRSIVLLRIIGERVLVIVADSEVNASLLRVTLDVAEHEWREEGLSRVFPMGKERKSGSARWSRIFGKRVET